ncbi:hypothetical protein GF376_04170 [Candidatus Peregrinibacteria bacterium]|nr:hypothetical protein [Candidatus Peregrinibacteria bacterium]
MSNKIKKLVILPLSIMLLALNITPLFAYTIEIEILGGGYKLRGPEEINFGNLTATFSEQISTINFRDIEIEATDSTIQEGGLVVIDENGGNEFSVTVSATQLTKNGSDCVTNPEDCIPLSNFKISNSDSLPSSEDIETIYGQPNDFSLDGSTNTLQDLSTVRTLGNGTGQAPGHWKIFPQLEITIPAGQKPGDYISTLSFTIA